HRRTGRNRRRGSLPRRPERLVHHRPDDRDRRRRHGGAIALLPGRTKSRALRDWRDSTTSSSRRRPGSRRRQGAPPRADAWRGPGAVSLLPVLRTVRGVLSHTALRSVVIYIETGAQERELAIG